MVIERAKIQALKGHRVHVKTPAWSLTIGRTEADPFIRAIKDGLNTVKVFLDTNTGVVHLAEPGLISVGMYQGANVI